MSKVKFKKVRVKKIKKPKLLKTVTKKRRLFNALESGSPSAIQQARGEALKLEHKMKRVIYSSRSAMKKIGVNQKLIDQYFSTSSIKTKDVFGLKSTRDVKNYIKNLEKQQKELNRDFTKQRRKLRRVEKFTATVEKNMIGKTREANAIIDKFISNIDAEMGMNVSPSAHSRPQANLSTVHGSLPLPYVDKYTDREAFEKEVQKWRKNSWDYNYKENAFRDSLKKSRDTMLERATSEQRNKINALYDKALNMTNSELTAFSRLNVYNSVEIMTSSSTDELLNNLEKINSVINRVLEAHENIETR